MLRNVTPTVENIKQINGIYNAIGGKEASQMGIAMGLQGAMEEINRNPDFQALEALELRLSGRTQSRLGKEEPSKETSISDFPSDSSLDPNSPNFDSEYFIFVNKQKQSQDFPPNFDFGNKEELLTHGQEEIRKAIPSSKTLSASTDPVYLKWIAKLGILKAAMTKFKIDERNWQSQFKSGSKQRNNTTHMKWYTTHRNKARATTSAIRTMSNDYRNPNNHIRENALRLRANMSQWIL